MMPEEAFIGKWTQINHFNIFGCVVYFHVPYDKRMNLESTAAKDIFIGYSKTSKGYKVYILAIGKEIFLG